MKSHDKILMLAKSKLDSIGTLVSQALINKEISHEQFNTIIREKKKYERMRENVTNFSERNSSKKQENIRLNKGAYLKYVGGGPECFTNFSKNIS